MAAIALLLAQAGNGQAPPKLEGASTTTFGVTVVDAYGLRGEIYLLDPDTTWLPNFAKLKPIGAVYTYALNIPPTSFSEGFPGITDRFEWFAIDYNGNFWITKPGKYRFVLTSDDGSKLLIDGKTVIDNDGLHSAVEGAGSVKLKTGIHKIRLQYFQGPRMTIALSLGVAGPDDAGYRVFSTREFRPPQDSEDSKK